MATERVVSYLYAEDRYVRIVRVPGFGLKSGWWLVPKNGKPRESVPVEAAARRASVCPTFGGHIFYGVKGGRAFDRIVRSLNEPGRDASDATAPALEDAPALVERLESDHNDARELMIGATITGLTHAVGRDGDTVELEIVKGNERGRVRLHASAAATSGVHLELSIPHYEKRSM